MRNHIHSSILKLICIIPSNLGYTSSHRDAALLWPAQGHLRRNVKKNTTPNPTGDFPVVPHVLIIHNSARHFKDTVNIYKVSKLKN